MRTAIRSTRTNAPLALPLAGALMAIALATPAQIASEPPYTVTDVGANYRVWQRTVSVTNSVTGEVSQQVQSYTELEDGMHYLSNGQWIESQDLVEVTPTGAQAVHGQMTARFNSDITSVGAISLTTLAGEVFQSHPLGLFYSDSASGKVAQIAAVQPSTGVLYLPNVILFSNVLSGLAADLMLVWTKHGYEQNLLLNQAPPPPESFGLSSATSQLQMWSAMDSCPTPQAEQSVVLPSGLVDHILFFSDSWMPVGSAFASANLALMQPGQAASIRLVSPWDPDAILTAKSLVTIGQQRVLIEEINYADLLAALMGLPQASLSPKQTKAVELAARSQLLPAPTVARPQRRPIEIASAPYTPHGVVLDYIQFTGGVSGYTFTNATYYISGTATVGGGGATFQAGACLKFASNACLVVSSGGAVSFPASGLPVVFTSKDDNTYGEIISNSTADPYYAGSPALWSYQLCLVEYSSERPGALGQRGH